MVACTVLCCIPVVALSKKGAQRSIVILVSSVLPNYDPYSLDPEAKLS